MSRRRKPAPPPTPEPGDPRPIEPEPPSPWLDRKRATLLVVLLLATHYALAADSLRRENPTIDEIAHLPAGVSYWQKGTFKLYHHNPPLWKLFAAIPVLLANPTTEPLYALKSWNGDPPSQASFGESFAYLNAPRYFELFAAARMVMPIFSVLGGLVVFAWSGRLYGRAGGLLSLALWCLCPNILANARLVTGDVPGASIGIGATFAFWCYLRRPTWWRAALAGVVLGLAQLTKFSLLLLYAYWPLLWLARVLIERDLAGWPRRLGRDLVQGLAIAAISVAVIDVGYGFEKVGRPLGSYEFTSRTLTRTRGPVVRVPPQQRSPNWIAQLARLNRVNRFRGTWLENVPAPLPYHFLVGFDEQRIETEGIPRTWTSRDAGPDETGGYWVYLDGTLRDHGWWYYYLACLAYKVPEGTWIVVLLSMIALIRMSKARPAWFDELAVLAFPAIALFAMTALTDINLGLRYIQAVFPFVFVGAGKVAPWIATMGRPWRVGMAGVVAVGLGLTAGQTASIHPHYLASFNWLAGGPDGGSRHLIDSNLDWGQDLVGLKRWVDEHRPGRRVGVAYFGQINPNIFLVRGDDFRWFIPPVLPDSAHPMYASNALVGPAPRLTPGLYAVSASLLRGLPWRLYDNGDPRMTWSAGWNIHRPGAFGYFADLTPIGNVGHSIFLYDLTEADCARINPRFNAGTPSAVRAP